MNPELQLKYLNKAKENNRLIVETAVYNPNMINQYTPKGPIKRQFQASIIVLFKDDTFTVYKSRYTHLKQKTIINSPQVIKFLQKELIKQCLKT